MRSLKNRDTDTLHPEEGVVVDAAPHRRRRRGGAAGYVRCAPAISPNRTPPCGRQLGPSSLPSRSVASYRSTPTDSSRSTRARSTGMKKLHVREQQRHGLLGRCCRAGLGDVVERHHRSCLCHRRPGAEEVLQRVGVTEQRRWCLRRAQRSVPASTRTSSASASTRRLWRRGRPRHGEQVIERVQDGVYEPRPRRGWWRLYGRGREGVAEHRPLFAPWK